MHEACDMNIWRHWMRPLPRLGGACFIGSNTFAPLVSTSRAFPVLGGRGCLCHTHTTRLVAFTSLVTSLLMSSSSSAGGGVCLNKSSTAQDMEMAKGLIPPLLASARKGQMGRIGVLGGSPDFTGAPYYAGISTLKVGADLSYILTATEAALPIKSYSPELMVTPVYTASEMEAGKCANGEPPVEYFVKKVQSLMPKLHVLVIGPGLGRDERVMEATERVIKSAIEQKLPMVIDADGLWLLAHKPDVIKGYKHALLTPNIIEFARLQAGLKGEKVETAKPSEGLPGPEDVMSMSSSLDGVAIMLKGPTEIIANDRSYVQCDEEGSRRRSGGLGDILAGTAAVTVHWANLKHEDGPISGESLLWAGYAAALIARRAGRLAFREKKRAMTAPDAIDKLGDVMQQLAPVDVDTWKD